MSFSEVVRSPYGYSTAAVRIMSRPLHSTFGAPAIGGLLRLAWDEHRRRMYECVVAAGYDDVTRSEEHTSELQSRRDLVCRLLLEKKKKKRHETNADSSRS